MKKIIILILLLLIVTSCTRISIGNVKNTERVVEEKIVEKPIDKTEDIQTNETEHPDTEIEGFGDVI